MTRRIPAICGIPALALGLVCAAQAQEDEDALDEVTVTAQKIEQNIIDVPISMTVMGDEELAALRVQGVEDYAVSIPNVTYLKGDRGGGPSLSIRGVSGDTGGAFSPINVTVDEIPFNAISSSQLLSMRSFDAAQIEVLRGPQGTLTGANALGGIVNLVTAKPDLTGFSAKTILDVGRFDTYLVQGALNTPLSDRFGLRTTAYHESSDGGTDNVGPAGGSSSVDNFGVRIAARWLATDALTFDVSFGHEKQRYGLNDFAYIDQFDDGPSSTSERRAEVTGFYDSFGGSFRGPSTRWWNEGGDNNGAKVSLDFPERDRFTYDIASLRANYDLGAHQVALLYGYFDNEGDTTWDADRTEYSHFAATVKRRVETHSAELRASSDYEGRLNWVAGLAWHDATTPYEEVGYATQNVLMSEFFMGDDALDPGDVVGDPNAYNRHDYVYAAQSDLTTRAVFANVFYDFTDRWHLSVGARFTKIEARFGDLCCSAEGDDFGSDLAGRTHDDLIAGLGAVVQPDGSSEEFNPRVTLNYDVTDNASAYVQFGTGFRPGVGNNVRVVEEGFGSRVADPEYMDNFEVGFKGLFLDNRLNLALAAFYMDYTDLQVTREAEVPIHEGIDETIFLTYTANAGKASVKGFEAEGTLRVTPAFQLRAGVGYADSTVEEFDGESYDPPLNMPGVRPWNAIFSALYDTQLTDRLGLNVRADYRWQDKGWVALFDDERNPGNFLPSWETLDLSATVSAGNWAVQAYFENVLDENYYTQQINWSFRPTAYYIPRAFGLRLTYDFGQ
jgi:iron complex outermembrane receptor protein